jgi:thiamine transport system permease protein
MNLPFASVLLSQAMASIPEHLWESATTLGLRPIQSLKSICFPAIRTPLLLISLVTFSVSMGTFGAVAILGGGPASQTLEMSTYIALFAYGDWRSAAIFAITHTAINAAAVAILLISQRKTFLHHVSAPFKKTEQAARWIIPNIIRSHAVKRSLIILSITFDIALAVPVCAVLYDAFALCFQSSVSTEVLNFLGRAALTSLGFAIPVAFLTTLSGWILSRGYFARASDTKSWQSGILLNTPMVGAMIPGMALAFGYWTIRSFRGSELGPNLFIIPTLTVLSMPFVIPLIFPSFARDVHPYLDARRLMGIPNFLWHRTVEGPAMLKPLLISTTLTLILTLNETSVVTVLRPPEDPALSSALLVLMGRYKFSEAALGSAILICVNFVFLAMAARSNEGCHGRS